ncbi:hypothetical protein GF352_02720 [archaeon]|nr:hypothetical protein [archaeon]
MNIFKGLLVCNRGTYLKQYIEQGFLEYLLTIHEKHETEEVSKEFKRHTRHLLNLCDRDKNFSLLKVFQRSCYVDPKDWHGSFTDYLKKVYSCLLSEKDDTELLTKTKKLLVDYELKPEEIEQLRKKGRKNLDFKLTGASSLSMALEMMGASCDFKLQSITFIENINTEAFNWGGGTSLWFNNLSDLVTISLYQTKIKKESNPLLKEGDKLGKMLNAGFGCRFRRELTTETGRYNDKTFESLIKYWFNNEFNNSDRVKLKPSLYFGTEDRIVMFQQGENELVQEQQDNLISLSMTCNLIEEQIYQSNIKPELTLIYLTQGVNNLIIIQKSSMDASIGVIYQLKPGEQRLTNALSINNKVLGKYLTNNLDHNRDGFIKEVREYFS